MDVKNKSLVAIHTAVFLFGLSGLFGKLIDLPVMIIVLGRVVFASAFLFMVLLYRSEPLKLHKLQDYFAMLLIGALLAVHWSSFFLSIKLSTVAIGLLTFSTFPVFVTFLEPYFFKERIKVTDIVVAAVAFAGVVLVVPEFQAGSQLTQGAVWGIVSGFTYALLSMLNRKYVKQYSSLVVAFYEQFIAAIILLPYLFLQLPVFRPADIFLLLVLGVVFTGIAHSLFIQGLKNCKTQTAGIISCFEPVYGIIFAALLLHEMPAMREIIGGSIILTAVLYSTCKAK